MNVEIVFAITHILWNYIFVIYLNLGVVGSGISSCITNALLFFANCYYTNNLQDLSEAAKVH